MKLDDLIRRAEQLLAKADKVLGTKHMNGTFEAVEEGLFRDLRSSALSFLAAAFGKEHPYYTEFNTSVKLAKPRDTREGRGILSAAHDEMAGGWLATTKGLVSAEIFADFLEMAQHLLDEGYKDPAAVVAGSVLEEHLRQLCVKNGIPIEVTQQDRQVPKKADSLNGDLGNAPVYNKLDQKTVTAWLDLRNKAAHGKYEEYSTEQVALMLQGVSDFMVRNSL
jgi:hypothetical protein